MIKSTLKPSFHNVSKHIWLFYQLQTDSLIWELQQNSLGGFKYLFVPEGNVVMAFYAQVKVPVVSSGMAREIRVPEDTTDLW